MVHVSGLIVINEMECDECGRLMKHPERYAYLTDEDAPPHRFCEDCCRSCQKHIMRFPPPQACHYPYYTSIIWYLKIVSHCRSIHRLGKLT